MQESDAERDRVFVIRDQWNAEAKTIKTPEALAAFAQRLYGETQHDYSTCVYAISAVALAAAEFGADALGITGFQAGAVMWEFIQHWTNPGDGGPMRLLTYHNMLFPQYEEKFDKTIPEDTATYLREQAAKNLLDVQPYTSRAVVEHWRKIADGWLPFGYRVVQR